MLRTPERLGQQPFDLLVIGGGILGAGIARDAALRGLSVALVEQGDFVSGTSSKTTKLVHGGLRYLEQYDVGLVRESCRERQALLTLAPHLVQPIPFVIPVFRGGPRPAWKIRAGVTVYDWLAGRNRLAPHQFYSARRLQELEPVLAESAVTAGAQYHDAQMDDIRLCLENVFGAVEHGAVAVNHARVVRFHVQAPPNGAGQAPPKSAGQVGRVAGAEVDSTAGPGSWLVRAKVVVNAAGPWADAVRRLADPHAASVVRRSKGIHLVYPKLPIQRALVLSAHRDGRVFFLIPWRQWTLIGTTDTDFDESPERARATPDDVTYLLEETNRLLPRLRLERQAIVTTFAGVRPLVAGAGGEQVPWHVSRGHLLHEDPNGLLTIVGGKYTTYRAIAEQVVDRVARQVGKPVGPCRTAELSLNVMQARRAQALAELIRRDARLAEPLCASHHHLKAEVRYAVEQEAAVTLGDLLWRRLEVAWTPCQGLDCAETAARVMADALGWDAAGIRRQVETYRAEVLANRVV